jgi:hypothetical protein
MKGAQNILFSVEHLKLIAVSLQLNKFMGVYCREKKSGMSVLENV